MNSLKPVRARLPKRPCGIRTGRNRCSSITEAKLIQALHLRATVYRVDGSYDQAYDLSLEYTNKYGGMSRSTAYNPMTREGKKTVSLEIFQQLMGAPDYLFVATGDGCILSGVYKGFTDLMGLGLIDKIPLIISAAKVVVLATGHGLKDNAAAVRGIVIPNQTIQSLNDIF